MTDKRPLISVIVPVYKVEQYLDQCVESIVNQTYRNLEIILIDDGSPDRCPEMCNAWSAKDSRIRVIHQNNSGQATARNVGLRVAKGSLVGFVDSDDWIAADMYEFLYSNLLQAKVDFSACQAMMSFPDERHNKPGSPIHERIKGESALSFKLVNSGRMGVVVWDKLYKKELFDGLSFPRTSQADDMYVLYQILDRAESFILDSVPKYYYRQRVGGQTKSKQINIAYVDVTKQMVELVKRKYPETLPYALFKYLTNTVWGYEQILRAGMPEEWVETADKLEHEIKENYRYVIRTVDPSVLQISAGERIRWYLISNHHRIFRFSYSLFCKFRPNYLQ